MSHLGLKARKSSLILLLLLFSIIAKSNSVYTSCQGKWDDPNSWRGGTLPVDGDSIFINHSLSLSDSLIIGKLVHVSNFGALCGNVTISLSPEGELVNYGYIEVRRIRVNGELKNYGSLYVLSHGLGGSLYSNGGGIEVPYKGSCPYYYQVFYNGCTPEIFSSPSGKYTYTKSGSYLDTLAGSGGCDSIVSVEVDLSDSATYLQKLSCHKYESPSGDYLWTQSGLYEDALTNVRGCDSLLIIDLSIQDCSCEIFIPNAFTPNGDGANDVFTPRGACEYVGYEFVVYNRNNERLFVSNVPHKGWNGMYMSRSVRSGTYIYSIKYFNNVTGYVADYGVVTLIR